MWQQVKQTIHTGDIPYYSPYPVNINFSIKHMLDKCFAELGPMKRLDHRHSGLTVPYSSVLEFYTGIQHSCSQVPSRLIRLA